MKWPIVFLAQNPESTWCSRIFSEKSSIINICVTTTSLRLAADTHSSSSCQNFWGIQALSGVHWVVPCMLQHTPLQQNQAVTTENLLLHTQPASIPLNSSTWIHFSLPQSSMPGSDCHGCNATFILSDTQWGLKPSCPPLPSPWALTLQNYDLDRENMAHRRMNWSGCQHQSLKDCMCHGI